MARDSSSFALPTTTWTHQGCMLVPLGARDATSRMYSMSARGTGVGRKARTEWRDVIASSTVRATSAHSGGDGSTVSGLGTWRLPRGCRRCRVPATRLGGTACSRWSIRLTEGDGQGERGNYFFRVARWAGWALSGVVGQPCSIEGDTLETTCDLRRSSVEPQRTIGAAGCALVPRGPSRMMFWTPGADGRAAGGQGVRRHCPERPAARPSSDT